jgi:hypothetical protein
MKPKKNRTAKGPKNPPEILPPEQPADIERETSARAGNIERENRNGPV